MEDKLSRAAEFIKKLTAENQSLNSQLQSTKDELQNTTTVLNKIKDKTRELLVQHKQDILSKNAEIEQLQLKFQSQDVSESIPTPPPMPVDPPIDIKPLQDQIQKLQLDVDQKSNEYNLLKNETTIKQNEFNDLLNSLNEKHNTELKSLQSEISQKQSSSQELQHLLKQMEVKSSQRINNLQAENKDLLAKIQTNSELTVQFKGEIELLKQDLSKINEFKQTISLLETQLNELKLDKNLKNNINDAEINKQLMSTINNLKMENEQIQQELVIKNTQYEDITSQLRNKEEKFQEIQKQVTDLTLQLTALKKKEISVNPKETKELKEKINKYEIDMANMIDRQLASDMILKYLKSDKKHEIILIMKEIFHWSDAELPLNITAEWVKWLNGEDVDL